MAVECAGVPAITTLSAPLPVPTVSLEETLAVGHSSNVHEATRHLFIYFRSCTDIRKKYNKTSKTSAAKDLASLSMARIKPL